MAYNADNEVKDVLAEIQKNNRGDFVIASKITNKNTGAVSVDIRQYYTNDADEVKPTSKGIRINTELLPELLAGLVKALEADEMIDLSETLVSIVDGDGDDEEESPEE